MSNVKEEIKSILLKDLERRSKMLEEFDQNSFIKMFSEGWCSDCAFDSSKCAEQHECEAYKMVEKAFDEGGKDEKTV